MTSPIALGPWKGANNVLDEAASAYAPPKQPSDPHPYLREAVNVDLDDEGYIRRRHGRRKLVELTNGHSLASIGPWLLVMDGDTLQWVDTSMSPPTPRPLAGGLSPTPMCWAYAGGSAFGCNGVDLIRVDPGPGAKPWSVPPPAPPDLSPTSGNLPPGQYLVALSCVTADGREHGARRPEMITLADTGGIQVSIAGVSPTADQINLYLSDTNGDLPYYHSSVSQGTSAVDLVSPAPTTDPITVLGLAGPPPGVDRVASFGGRVLVAEGKALYWSQPLAYHLFDWVRDVQLLPSRVTMIAPLNGGFYLADEQSIYWVEGTDPTSWRPRFVLEARSARGSPIILPERTLPQVDKPGTVTVWVTSDGLVAGAEDGTVQLLHQGTLALDIYQRASVLYRRHTGVRQLLAALDQPAQPNQLQATDRADCVVTRVPRAGIYHTACASDSAQGSVTVQCQAAVNAYLGEHADCFVTNEE